MAESVRPELLYKWAQEEVGLNDHQLPEQEADAYAEYGSERNVEPFV